jgi:hypothetical protein
MALATDHCQTACSARARAAGLAHAARAARARGLRPAACGRRRRPEACVAVAVRRACLC